MARHARSTTLTSILYSHGPLEGWISFFSAARRSPPRHVRIDARPAARKIAEVGPTSIHDSKGTMSPHRRQPGGPLGLLDALGAIRWISGAVPLQLPLPL